MGLTTDYTRFSASGDPFGLIGSSNSCIRYVKINGIADKYVATSGLQHINIWDIKTQQLIYTIGSGTAMITYFAVDFTNEPLIAIGRDDGSIQIVNYATQDLKITFNGHKGAITCLSFDSKEMRLVSGGVDTTIIVWDIVNECGLFKLKGHKNLITQVKFMKNHNCMISSSKDGTIKFWDLETQHCFKTFIAHRNQVLDFILIKNDTRLITGSDELKVWKIQLKSEAELSKENTDEMEEEEEVEDSENVEDESSLFKVTSYGSILRECDSRFRGFGIDSKERFFLSYGVSAKVECFKIRTDKEITLKVQKKARKERNKKSKKRLANENEPEIEETFDEVSITIKDEIERLESFKASAKVKFCDIFVQNQISKVTLLLMNNTTETFSFNLVNSEVEKLGSLENEGHRTDVRTVSFSADNLLILSASSDSLKIWNRSTRRCITTIKEDFEYALCSLFVHGDKYAITGTKTGKLQIFDIGLAEIIETIEASEEGKPIWSICAHPDGKSIISGSEDKIVKFWDLELVKSPKTNKMVITLVHSRTLSTDEGVLCVQISPNSKFIAVSMLDCTVKIFYLDTLKFFLSLYGHKLPVLSMDISDDSSIIVTGSGDKNLKIWGLDFGDCRRSIFAHDEAITGVKFVPNSKLLFTCSRDKTIKYWNASDFERIMTLKGHQSEVWCLACSPNGKYLVSASHDKTLRLWMETDELLILEEEREIEREEELNNLTDDDTNRVIPGDVNQESSLPVKSTKETIIATERLIEAIDIFKEQIKANALYNAQCQTATSEGKKPPKSLAPNPVLSAFKTDDPYRYIYIILTRIKPSEIQETILSLPFNYVSDLLIILTSHLEKGWDREMILKYICFIIRTHFGQISSTPRLIPTIDKLRSLMKPKLMETKDLFGFNQSAFQFLQSEIESREEIRLFYETFNKKREKSRNKRKKARKVVENAPILSLK